MSDITLQIAQRLFDLGDRLGDDRLSTIASQLHHCMVPDVDDDRPWRWRCGIRSLCGYCGVMQAKRASLALDARYRGTPHTRVLLTRTVIASTILEGFRVLSAARYAQNRSTAWCADFIEGRGQVEFARTPDDDGWVVHVHELALMRSPAHQVDHKHSRTWTRMIGAEGLTGEFDARIEKPDHDRSDGRRVRTFRKAVRCNGVLRLQDEAHGVAGTERRRACRVRAERAATCGRQLSRPSMRRSLRPRSEEVMCTNTRTTTSTRFTATVTNRTSRDAYRYDRASGARARKASAADGQLIEGHDHHAVDACDWDRARRWMGRRPLRTRTDRHDLRGLVLRSGHGLGQTPFLRRSSGVLGGPIAYSELIFSAGDRCSGSIPPASTLARRNAAMSGPAFVGHRRASAHPSTGLYLPRSRGGARAFPATRSGHERL